MTLGHRFNPRFELVGEVFDNKTMGADRDTIFDLGGRYGFHKGLLLLFTGRKKLQLEV
ncbi:MAG: hypothetical protein WA715_28600 [Candidatus Acidiferrum sp.]